MTASLTEPKNAAELQYLVGGRGSLAERTEALAYLHGRGLFLPETRDPAAVAAWAKHKAPPAPPPPARPAPTAAESAASVQAGLAAIARHRATHAPAASAKPAVAPPAAPRKPAAPMPTVSPDALLIEVGRVRLGASDDAAEGALDTMLLIAGRAKSTSLTPAAKLAVARALDARRVELHSLRQTAGARASLSVLSRTAALVNSILSLR
jgi:hypothetical protein